eukprot:8404420-Pyramimonas_sp.AAC.1
MRSPATETQWLQSSRVRNRLAASFESRNQRTQSASRVSSGCHRTVIGHRVIGRCVIGQGVIGHRCASSGFDGKNTCHRRGVIGRVTGSSVASSGHRSSGCHR